MKKLSLVFAMVLLAFQFATAQRTVTGKVTDAESGAPLISANVLVKGTSIGTVTDVDGKYSIDVAEGSTTLVFSYIGYTDKEVTLGASNVVDVSMAEGVTLNNVVVTALGIKRDKKTLGYATQEVGGDEVTRVKDANFINSLSGKVAGVDIKRSNQMGGSSNVIVRGYKSLTGNNQALFVVDGVPISNDNNNTTNQQTGRGGYDYGNAAMDINPEDIASINILKGAAATALYGSRAANGVVLVTTKRGRKGKNLGISVSSGITVGQIDKSTMVRYQDKYAQGYGQFYGPDGDEYFNYYDFGQGDGLQPTLPTGEDASYGAAFDANVSSYDWRSYHPQMTEWYGKKFPLTAAANTPVSFYETATTYNTNVAITGGTEKSSYRLSYTNFNQSGVLPNSKIGKNTIAFSGGYDITPKLKATSSINYVATEGRGRYGTGYSGQNVNQSFRQWYNVGADIVDQKMAYDQTGLNITWNPQGSDNPSAPGTPAYTDNFYFMRNESFSNDNRSRMFGNVVLEYAINDWLDLTGRVTTDRYSEIQEERIAVGAQGVSSYSRFNKSFYENNFDLFLKGNKYLGDENKINISGLVGTNLRRTGSNSVLAETNGGLSIPKLYSLSNSVNAINAPTEVASERAVNGFYAQGTVGYDNMLYLDLTARQDYSSTLPSGANGYFYPSASLSFIFSELMDNTSIINFGKLRLNYAEVGNDAPFASLVDIFDLNTPFNTPLASAPSTANNLNLRPEKTRNYEAGLDMYFLNSKLHLDASIYRSNTFDQIIPVAASGSTGRLARYVNVGDVQNQGVEVALTFKAIKTPDFSWDIGINWARNRNKVIALADGQDNFQLSSSQGGITLNATVGESFGSIWGSNYVYDKYNTDGTPATDAKPVVEAHNVDGVRYSRTAAPEVIGNINPDWKGGISNSFTYKNFAFSFLIDCQKGGQFFSLDTWYGYATGLYDFTAETNSNGKNVRDLPSDGGGFIIDGAVIKIDENTDGTPVYGANTEAFFGSDYRSALGYARAPNAYHIWDATFVKLREISLTYSLPASAMTKTPFAGMNVSLIGRNLWIIYKASTYSDPESGLSAGNYQGNQSGAYPAVKEVGLNVSFKF
jgi:TonB-linked SusC/RagA family outer membrane protein